VSPFTNLYAQQNVNFSTITEKKAQPAPAKEEKKKEEVKAAPQG